MSGSEFAETLREAAEVLSVLADVVEKRMGGDDVDAVMANAAMVLQETLSGKPICQAPAARHAGGSWCAAEKLRGLPKRALVPSPEEGFVGEYPAAVPPQLLETDKRDGPGHGGKPKHY